MSDITTMMRAANPVPEALAALPEDESDALLLLARSRSGNVEVKERETSTTSSRGDRRGWIVAAVAFATIIAVLGVAILLARPSGDEAPASTPPTTQPATPTTEAAPTPESAPPTTEASALSVPTTTAAPTADAGAVAYVEALVAEVNAGDYEAAGARILSANEFRSQGITNDPRTIIAGMYQYWVEMDSVIEVTECRTSSTSGITRCVLSRTSEFEPFAPEPETTVFLLRLDDGDLAFAAQDPDQLGPWWQSYVEFRGWVGLTYPGTGGQLDNYTAGAAALTKEYVAEWKASLEE